MVRLSALADSSAPPAGWRSLAGVLLLALAWDAAGWDLAVMAWLAGDAGFPLRHHFWLEGMLHDQARQLAILGLLAATISAFLPWGILKQLSRWQRFEAISGTLLALLAVNLIKNHSLTSCPWELEQFGGVAHYVSHWAWSSADGGPGRCFPGGHASAGFAFLALAWPWFQARPLSLRRVGLLVLALVIAAGLVFGLVQTLRGAHYPSHTLWTAVICGVLTWCWHQMWVFLTEKVQ